MYIDPPTWYLKQRCTSCQLDGLLQLMACKNCNKIIALCDLCNVIFIDPLNIDLKKMSRDLKDCPFCGIHNNFRVAKDYEVIALGLTTNEYE